MCPDMSAASAMFPFLDPAEIGAAQARWADGATTDDACLRLIADAERIRRDAAFADPLGGRIQSNLFVVQSLLFEASLAFRLTGDERHAEPVRRLLTHLSDDDRRRRRLPDEIYLGFTLPALGVAAHLCEGVVDGPLVRRLAAAMGGDLAASARHAPWGRRLPGRAAWNHTAVGYAGLGCAGLICRDEAWGRAWVDEALERLLEFVRVGVTESGMTREGLDYAGFVFRTAAPFLLACRNLGVFDYRDPADNPYLERLRRVPGWYAMEVFPGGSWVQNLNDANWDPRRAMGGFLPLFGPLDPPTVAWVHQALLGARGRGDQGQDPTLVASALFESVLWPPGEPAPDTALPRVLADPDAGYLAERVRDGVRGGFSLTCGTFHPGIHGQSDNGSVTLFAGDLPVLIDSGAANDPTEGSVSSSHGHNVVLVDHRGQRPAGRGKGVSGTIVRVTRSRVATVSTCDLAPSYRASDYNPVAHAVRHCLYVKQPFPYLLVVDDVARPGGRPATFEQLFHTPPASHVRLGGGRVDLRLEFDGVVGGVSIVAADPSCTVGQRSIRSAVQPWPEHPVWVLARRGPGGPVAALVRPGDPGGPPHVSVSLDGHRGRATVCWEHGTDRGTDLLTFTPGRARPAGFAREGMPRADVTTLVGPGRRPWRPRRRSRGGR